MKKIFFLLPILSLILQGCPFESNVTMELPSGNYYLTELPGNYYVCDLENGKILEKDTLLSIVKNKDDSFVGITMARNGNTWVKIVDSSEYNSVTRSTNIGENYFLESKIKNGKYEAYRYTIRNGYLTFFSLNDEFIGGSRTFNSTSEYRNYISNNSNNGSLFEKELLLKKVSDTQLKDDNSETMAAALLLLLGAIIFSGDNEDAGSGGGYDTYDSNNRTRYDTNEKKEITCSACRGSGEIIISVPYYIELLNKVAMKING